MRAVAVDSWSRAASSSELAPSSCIRSEATSSA